MLGKVIITYINIVEVLVREEDKLGHTINKVIGKTGFEKVYPNFNFLLSLIAKNSNPDTSHLAVKLL